MSKNNIDQRLVKYIDKIGTIIKGERNSRLYEIGLSFRGKFGLTGDALETALHEVNQTKCESPLPDDEVATIARSVDKADIPIRESIEYPVASKQQQTRKVNNMKQKIEYCVSVKSEPINVSEWGGRQRLGRKWS